MKKIPLIMGNLYCNILTTSALIFCFSSLILTYPCIVYGNEKQWLDSSSETECTVRGYEINSKKYCLKECWSGNVLFLIQPSNSTIFNKEVISDQDSSRSVMIAMRGDYSIGSSKKCWYNPIKKELRLSLTKYNNSIFGIVLCCVLSGLSGIAILYTGYKEFIQQST